MVGVPKVEKDLFVKGRRPTLAQLTRRCVRDARITYRFAQELASIYGTLDERPRMTLASSAMHLWREQFWKRDVYRPDDEIWTAALSAYHGGRTEVFRLGEHRAVTVIDAASMFPWAMVQGRFPIPWGPWRRLTAWAGSLGLYRARLDVPQGPLPRLPYRSHDGTIFPVGRFEGWYTGEDLEGAASAGTRVTIQEGYEFHDHARPFDRYVKRLFALKNSSRGPLKAIYKTLLNCLYGKFGQQGRVVETMPLERLEMLPESRRPPEWFAWCGLAIFTRDGDPPPWGNNLWSAMVTARARQRLADEIERVQARGGSPIYCDTDSVVFNGARLRYPARAKAPGDFETRGQFRRAIVIGKKEYALEDMRGKYFAHAKGVPFAMRRQYLETGSASFERPTRLREAMRSGETPNRWKTVSKQRHVTFDHRSRMPDGALLPVVVNDCGESSGDER
jgi:hypothetical protein